jgi:RNA polymerase sigma-70 factor, ECF subfamily
MSAIQGFGRPLGRGTRLALLQVMVRLTTSQNNDLVELRVEGELTESTTHEVEQLSRSYLGAGRKVVLRLAGATFADRTGVELLRNLQRKGVMLTECSGFFSELLRGKPEPSLGSTGEPRNGDGLVERLKAHDEEAFETMVRQYGGRMLATARRLLGNEHDANDAVQQTFISVFKSIAGFNGEAKLSTWLHRIVVNAALGQMRYRRRRPELPIDDLLPRFDEEGRWAGDAVQQSEARENLTDGRETQEMVRRCIDRLPEVYRSVLVLRDIEELDTAEAAKMLAVTPNAAKIRLHRARQAFKTLIERERCLL